jgi:hypothetical protein
MALPKPLTPPDLDLRGFTYMPLEVVRLRDSDLVVLASGEEFRAAVLLWCAAWHQLPAASLPRDDRMLANLAGFGRDLKGWRTVSEAALRGFIECSDGRLYHPVIAEKAIESGSKKRKQVSQTAAATEARRAAKAQRDEAAAEEERQRNDNVTSNVAYMEQERNEVQGIGTDGKGEEPNGIDLKTRVLFDEFWKTYPRRDSDEQRERSEEKFSSLLKTGVDPKVVIFGAKAYCAKIRKQNSYATQYVKVAWRWLSEQDYSGIADTAAIEETAGEPAGKDWRGAVKLWLVNESNWPKWAGNDPRSPVCRCPPEIMAECGFCPNTKRRIDASWWFAEIDTIELAANLSLAAEHRLKVKTYKITIDGVEKEGAWFMKRIPPGYDEATGERIAPQSAEDAA